mmetsp:Transcript_19395/g.33287  ORF Transcript_19395/g.33287 Transcript_19395/m.33287 type:complete len:323 (+) Transcript_19395:233-1201(+)
MNLLQFFVFSMMHHAIVWAYVPSSSSSSPRVVRSTDSENNEHDIRVSIAKTNDDIISLADLRYQEWMVEDSNPPRLSSFRMATAEIFHEREGDNGPLVFLASMPCTDASGDRVTVGAAELSPIELKGVFISSDENSYRNAQCEALSLYITDVVTSSKYRRYGIGSRVMNALERNAQKLGARFLFLHVEDDNVGARQFYKRLGYQDVDVQSISGEDASEENGVVSFSLENGELLTPRQMKKLKDTDDLVAMDTNRLADNAGTVGQQLMMKVLPSQMKIFNNGCDPTTLLPLPTTETLSTDSLGIKGAGFGKQKVKKRQKSRRR